MPDTITAPIQGAAQAQNTPLLCKELRLALVCYGGVSLAIYMHGITVKLQHLVEASAVFCQDPHAENPFNPEETQWAYWEALRSMADNPDGDHTKRCCSNPAIGGASSPA